MFTTLTCSDGKPCQPESKQSNTNKNESILEIETEPPTVDPLFDRRHFDVVGSKAWGTLTL